MGKIISTGGDNSTRNNVTISSGIAGRVVIFVAIAAIVIAVLISIMLLSRPYTYQGSLIDPAMAAPEIQMDDQSGELFSLDDQQGKVVLIFFGYTHCPDVCPVTLYQFKQIREALGERSEDVIFVFITVDPERDTREVIKTHLAKFDPTIIGLTSDLNNLEKVWGGYGVAQEKREGNSASGYFVDHTARLYAVDKNGNLRLTYPFGIETEKIVDDVDNLLRENEG